MKVKEYLKTINELNDRRAIMFMDRCNDEVLEKEINDWRDLHLVENSFDWTTDNMGFHFWYQFHQTYFDFDFETNKIQVVEIEEITETVVNYHYLAKTHWTSDGVCRIEKGKLRWGSGGVNEGFSDYEIAKTMSKAFKMASKRLKKLKK